jgi:hypothetical protein
MTPQLRPFLAPASLALLLAGCSAHTVRVDLVPGKPLPAQAMAVFPFDFRWETPAWRSWELSQVLTSQIVATNRYMVFGPGEFKLIRGEASNPFLGSDLVLSIADHGVSPTAALVLRPSAERRVHSELKQLFDSDGKPRGSERVEFVTVFARLEAFHSATRERVATAQGSVEIDPFAARDGSDPLPELTALMKQMTAKLLDELEERAPGEEIARAPGFEFLWNPKAGLDFALEDKPPLRQRLEQSDPLERDLIVENQLRFFHPDLDLRTVVALKKLPGGLWVTEVDGRARAAGLQVGDLVVEVAGAPAHPQSLHRALRQPPPGSTIDLLVERAAGRVQVRLPVE